MEFNNGQFGPYVKNFSLEDDESSTSNVAEFTLKALDENGDPAAPVSDLGNSINSPVYPVISFNTDEYGIAWQEASDNDTCIYYILSSQIGSGDPVRLSAVSRDAFTPHLDWNGSYFSTVWNEIDAAERDYIYFTY